MKGIAGGGQPVEALEEEMSVTSHERRIAAKVERLEAGLKSIAAALKEIGIMSELLLVEEQIVPQRAHPRLTPREREVIRQLRTRRRASSIAEALSLSVYTVRNHLSSIFHKYGVKSQEELLRRLELG